jgi:peptidyl-prolyl cis-trans isomerase D
MLQAIHDRVMGIIGWLILGLLIVTFAFFGLNSYLKSSAESYAAKVNGTEISRAEVQRGYERTLRRMRQLMGDKYDPALINEAQIRKTTLDSLINEYLVVQAADAAGLAASESALAAQISSVEQFKDKGVFSKERYTRLLGYQGMTPALFEHKLSREIIASQLKAGITLTAAATRQDLQRDYALQAQVQLPRAPGKHGAGPGQADRPGHRKVLPRSLRSVPYQGTCAGTVPRTGRSKTQGRSESR